MGWAGGWSAVFLPWSARPDRDAGWYEMARADVLARTGFLDDLNQEYPATDLEALAPRSADVRLAPEWLVKCSDVGRVREVPALVALPGLECYQLADAARPLQGAAHRYVIGADPAEGNPQSDQSAACVVDWETGAEVASLAGRFDPAVFAGYLARLSQAYGRAPVLVERNNHGHAVLLALQEWNVECLAGIDGKAGWLTTAKSKAMAYDYAAERLSRGDCRIRSAGTLRELQAICGSTLRAPEGQTDDRAMAFVLGLAAMRYCGYGTGLSAVVPAVDVIAEADAGGGW